MQRRWRGAARWLGLVAGMGVWASCGGGLSPPPADVDELASSAKALNQTLVFTPVADARVSSLSPATNYGLDSALTADTTPTFESYLKFNVSGVAGVIVSAKLRLYAFDGTDAGPVVYRTQGPWSETGITWNSRPARLGAELAWKDAVPSGSWMELDVTEAVRTNGEHSFVLVPRSGDSVSFRSKELSDRTLWPQLVVTVDPCQTRTDTFDYGNDVYIDTHVSATEPTARFSSASQLVVDASPRRDAYLQFYVYNAGLKIRRAVVRLRARSSVADGPKLYRAQEPWPSSDPSWNDRPAIAGAPVADAGAISAGNWVEYDVTSMMQAGREPNTYSFALVADSADEALFLSREGAESEGHDSDGPTLLVTWESEPYCGYRGSGGGVVDRSQQMGSAGTESASATFTTSSGELVIAGTTTVGGSFGGATFLAPGMVVAKYSADGAPLWSRSYGDGSVQPTGVTVTPLGNVLVVGTYLGAADLGTGRLPDAGGVWNMFILKLSPSGAPVWARGFQAGMDHGDGFEKAPIRPRAVTTDANGSLIVTGGFYSQTSFGGGVLDAGVYPYDDAEPGMFLAKLSWEGQHLWSKAYSGGFFYASRTEGLALATDGEGNILLGGAVGAQANLGLGPVGGSTSRPFVAKVSSGTGQTLWARVFNGDAYGAITAVTPLANGRVGFAGHFANDIAFGGRTYSSRGEHMGYYSTSDILVGALSSTGLDEWLQQIGGESDDRAIGLGVDTQGRLALAGTFSGAADAGGGTLGTPRIGWELSFVARYNATGGAHLWSRTLDPDLRLQGLGVQPGSSVMTVGQFARSVELGAQTFTPRGGDDLLLLRLTP